MNSNTTLDVGVYKDHKDHREWKELSKSRQRVNNCWVVWVGCDELFLWLPTSAYLGYTGCIQALERASSILDS